MTDLAKYGPWAVIAGGSEGVGAEFARQLAEAGFNLVLIARKPGPLSDTAEQCRDLGVEVRAISVDLLDPQSVSRIAQDTADLEVGLLIYNAGASTCNELFLDTDLAEFQKVTDLNVTRMLELVQHYGRLMADRGRGGIMIVGSLSGYMGSWRHSIYAGAKAFSRMFAESLWLELRERNVDVLELVLGVTRTPAMERVGLNFDAPGILVNEPAEVAAEGVAHLADGPVWVAGGNADSAEANSAPDRARVVLETHRAIAALIEGAR
ncbi:short-chain dehydrogenase [Mycolicibacterium conceptionense]|uniref:Short-chain dehydrogenase n=2 Tax=Mycolicibacterium TaxID=1866885 RepID=A0A1A2VGY5_9MYCO|nr:MULTISPECIES: SDR family NAD(P)-dependent oxidoreductase [Mycolicibacterium]MCW1820156.1 SDR family NAD(P)-dependent oxidoreductase [Mycolicibacterium senegalense]OBB07323.1 short-chain dehydrogenase [Mycolicibacterium conceptionense]OBF02691.1 short-chain dehydrogenase [Mycolicibacterium conceptionense]OBF23466.1 short-chain dehydrogenase [Mycolicibacterium conceptionense]OBF35237.1 short-chain dehydrogenase [Mycolicibacterium conceptionense]